MRAILTFLALTFACLGLAAGLIAIASHTGSRRPLPPQEPKKQPEERPAVVPSRYQVPGWPAGTAPPEFRAPAAPTPEDETTFRAVFDSLRQALAGSDEAAIASLFDFQRLAQELEPYGIFRNIPGGDTPGARDAFIRGMREGMVKSLIANTLFRWERTQIRRVQLSIDGREALVTAHHRSAILGDRAYKMRWWLIRGSEDWFIYDMEELEMGLRVTRVAASTIPAVQRDFAGNPARLQLATAAVREAMAAILVRENVDEADEKLQDARGVPLPGPLAALREMIEGLILFGRGAPDAALERFDAAGRLQPDVPVLNVLRSTVIVTTGRYDEALALVDKYLAEVGPDPDALSIRGAALEGLNRLPEAIQSYRQALDELPDLVEVIQGLRRVLENDQKREIALRVSRTADPLKTYDAIYWDARQDNDSATLDALRAWLRRAYPNDPRWICMQLNDLVDGGHAAEAGVVLRERLARGLPDEVKRTALHAYLFSMIHAERSIEAYSAVPDLHAAIAFRILADDVDGRFVPLPLNPEDRTLKLERDLIDLHRKRVPDDPWLLYFEGQLLVNEGRLAEAERTFAAGQAKLPPQPKFEDDDPDDDDGPWDSNRFRIARVYCLYQMKEGLRAYAEVGPVAETFSQLAFRYYHDKDAPGLEALVEAHRKREPKDRQLLYWSAELSYLREKYTEASEAFLKFLAATGEDEQNRWAAIDRSVRAYLRVKMPAKAQEAVAAIGMDKVHPGLRAAVHLANSRADLAEGIIAEESKNRGAYYMFYFDEDFVRLIKQPEFESLRKKYPDPRAVPTGEKPG